MEVGRNQNLGLGTLVGRIGKKVPKENARAINTYIKNVIEPQGVSVQLKDSSFIIDKENKLTKKDSKGFASELRKMGAAVRSLINPK